MTVSKNDLIEAVSTATGLSKKDAQNAINALAQTITDSAQKGVAVSWSGFGNFSVRERAARTGRNPATGETIQIAASKSLGFKPGKQVKDALNG